MTSDKNASYTDIHPPEPGGEDTASDHDTSPGQLLARRREALGLSVQQAADDLHLTMHYVRALEADAHEKLPGVVFIRGYIRAYASYLKLDPTLLVNVFNEFINQRDSTGEEASFTISRRRRDRNRPWIVISGIAFVAIAVALWYSGTGAGAPVATPSAATAPAPAILNNAASRPAAAVSTSSVTPPATSTATPAPAANVGLPVPMPTVSAAVTTTPVPAIDVATAPVAAATDAPAAAADVSAEPVSQATAPSSSAVPAATATPAAAVAPAAVTAPAAATIPATTTTPAATTTPPATTTPAAPATPAASAAAAQDARAAAAAQPAAQAVQRVTPTQVITVDAGGSDLVEILFSGESLVQIDDGSARQIYREIRAAGDHLRLNGTGPFNVLLGDAAAAELHLNGKKIDFTESIRIDNSARLTIGL